jgi:glycosyltransferase involved in cell wall biosynthesis
MSNFRILVVNDFASNGFLFQRYLNSKVNVIYFNTSEVISKTEGAIYFEEKSVLYQARKLAELAAQFDLCVSFGWIAAGLCYLANVNYIMYFVDSYIEPQDRIRKKMSVIKKKFLDKLYEEAIKNATCLVTGVEADIATLKRYNPNVRLMQVLVDKQMFNPCAEKIELREPKFTFFSPARIEEEKGQMILWDSIRLSTSDFVVLQTDWGSGPYYDKVIATKPEKVKIIPKIPRHKMPSYYVSADALLGQISRTSTGGIEREAALCGVPIFCYAPLGFGAKGPFYKGKIEPEDIAKYLDKIVEDRAFREDLAKRQHEWAMNLHDNDKTVVEWEKIFGESISGKPHYKPKKRYDIALRLFRRIKRTSSDF